MNPAYREIDYSYIFYTGFALWNQSVNSPFLKE